MKLSRKVTIIILSVLAIFCSLYTAFASNYFFNDVLNKAIITENIMILATFPMLFLAVTFIAIFFYFLRLYKRPNTFKKHTRSYLILTTVLNALGFVTSILTGVLCYGTMLSIYPFPAYPLIMMLVHLAFLAGDIVGLVFIRKAKEDTEVFKIKVGYVFKTIGWFLFACLAFNRFGTLLVSPMFIHWRTLGLTFLFYLFLAVPMLLGIYKVLVDLGVITKKLVKIIVVGCLLGFFLITGIYTGVVGMLEPVFVSAISVSMPLERLASLPVEYPIHMLSYLAVSIILLIQAIKTKPAQAE